MSPWRQLTHGLRGLMNRTKADQDLSDEIRQYFEEAAATGMAHGLSADEARRAARLELGNMTAVQEQVRSYGWENVLRTVAADLHYAARQLRANSGFTIVSALTLALGIGASTAIFSVVNPILFEPLPYPHSNRIMMIWNTYQGVRTETAFGTYREIKERTHALDAIAVFEPWQPALTGGIQPERLTGQRVSASYFAVIGVAPILGRDFQPSEDIFHGSKVVILSDRLWQRRFHGDRTIIGHQVKLDDDDYTIIGVMPHSFENVLAPSTEIWSPMQYDTRQIASNFNTGEWGLHLNMAGRLKPAISMEQVRHELDQIASTPLPEFPRPRWASLRQGLIVDSLRDDIAHGIKPALLAVLGAVLVVLTIACVNVINLLLARSAHRRGEFGIRAALGAGRLRIIRQLITESLLLASLGGALGMGIAVIGVRAVIALSPAGLPRLDAIAIDHEAFVFALGVTTLAALITGLIPGVTSLPG